MTTLSPVTTTSPSLPPSLTPSLPPSHCLGGTWFTTYTSVPQYITSYQRSLFLESMEYTVFDLTAEDSVLVKIDSNEISGRIITGQSSCSDSIHINGITNLALRPLVQRDCSCQTRHITLVIKGNQNY